MEAESRWAVLVVCIFSVRRQQEVFAALGTALREQGSTDFHLALSHSWGYRLEERRLNDGRTQPGYLMEGGPRRPNGWQSSQEQQRRS